MRDGTGTPATLIVFERMLRTGGVGKRFRKVDIDISFQAHGLRREGSPAMSCAYAMQSDLPRACDDEPVDS
ncbi:hypothetical protein N656DRAFT_801315 [Canariomyces notabilis]|uniref:Uncharacterized protein n=1 Tax=Canariomyces notabilis TaxID=2074819 RepID=A0AAN6QL69_9PEZI|nr:hypothetical protein N656DRAFT_801315 [Canariomyces arenarius]